MKENGVIIGGLREIMTKVFHIAYTDGVALGLKEAQALYIESLAAKPGSDESENLSAFIGYGEEELEKLAIELSKQANFKFNINNMGLTDEKR